ncbi:DPP IV N-terminal domain-containing protein [bacterium]|nr:DPP IV N-terminal domain-containing protein [bacterium]
MKKLAAVVTLCIIALPLLAQGTLEDYQRAESMMWKNVDKMIFHTTVTPHWIEKSPDFWYRDHARDGHWFYKVVTKKNTKTRAFDHHRMAVALSDLLDKEIKPGELPFKSIKYIDKGGAIEFMVEKKRIRYDLKTYALSLMKKETEKNKQESISPDKKWTAFLKGPNLWIRNAETKEEWALTTDGKANYDYAASRSWYSMECISHPGENKDERSIDLTWSPDSKKLVTSRTDRRDVGRLWLYQACPDSGYRAKVWAYERSLPGETNTPYKEYVIFDAASQKRINVALAPQSTVVAWGSPTWFKDSSRLYLQQYERGYQELNLLNVDVETGAVRTVIKDVSETQVDVAMRDYRLLEKRNEVVWMSERSGWSMLYRYDWETGQKKNAITMGEFVVRSILHVDEDKGRVYFLASGRETGRDPYYQHLYRVGLDVKGLKLLTPEDGEHSIRLSPDKKYIVDSYSRVDLPPVHKLRRLKDGKLIRNLGQGDVSDLLATGWQFPERFKAKARDGETDIYGVIFRPSNFDLNKKYPVIDGSYSGPQAVRTPKSFRRGCRNSDVELAELGFIVITVDGLGTANRSKAFHDFSYRNLGDIGADDHIAAFRQLAEKYPYIDLDHVGIYGHSAGGYDAAHALLIRPDFYDVAVASAGNHDHQMAKAWWPEHWMGFPVDSHYVAQSNLYLAKNLTGKLLLVHGDMDNNVNPASSLRLAGELIKANKDFDLLMIPNRNHGLGGHNYFTRKRWDYFVRYLLGVEPPKEYEIGKKE